MNSDKPQPDRPHDANPEGLRPDRSSTEERQDTPGRPKSESSRQQTRREQAHQPAPDPSKR